MNAYNVYCGCFVQLGLDRMQENITEKQQEQLQMNATASLELGNKFGNNL